MKNKYIHSFVVFLSGIFLESERKLIKETVFERQDRNSHFWLKERPSSPIILSPLFGIYKTETWVKIPGLFVLSFLSQFFDNLLVCFLFAKSSLFAFQMIYQRCSCQPIALSCKLQSIVNMLILLRGLLQWNCHFCLYTPLLPNLSFVVTSWCFCFNKSASFTEIRAFHSFCLKTFFFFWIVRIARIVLDSQTFSSTTELSELIIKENNIQVLFLVKC